MCKYVQRALVAENWLVDSTCRTEEVIRDIINSTIDPISRFLFCCCCCCCFFLFSFFHSFRRGRLFTSKSVGEPIAKSILKNAGRFNRLTYHLRSFSFGIVKKKWPIIIIIVWIVCCIEIEITFTGGRLLKFMYKFYIC